MAQMSDQEITTLLFGGKPYDEAANTKTMAAQAHAEAELRAEYLSHRAAIADRKRARQCPKCDGTGVLPQYFHVQRGVCFRCSGSGRGR